MKFSKPLLAAALAIAAGSSHAATLVTNGSFEADLQTGGDWSFHNNLTGWTGNSNIELRNNMIGTAQDGVNFVELDTDNNQSMSQLISTGTGWYDLSFWYAARPGVGLGDNTLGYSFGSLTGTILDNAEGTSEDHNWLHFNQSVYLNGPTLLTFSALGVSNSYGGSIDNVSVTAISAVPEPESYALLLAGLGLMSVVVRRRKLS